MIIKTKAHSKWWLTTILYTAFSFANSAEAHFTASPMEIDISGLDKKQSVRVFNEKNHPIYLQVSLEKIENPGEVQDKTTSIEKIAQPELMFNPKIITLGPRQEREINLLPLKMPSTESAYRLNIIPIANTKVKHKKKDEISAPLTINIAYGVVVRHQPLKKNQIKQWMHRCVKNEGIELIANGNIHNKFTELTTTSKVKKDEFISLKNVYVGTPIIFKHIKQLKGKADEKAFEINCP